MHRRYVPSSDTPWIPRFGALMLVAALAGCSAAGTPATTSLVTPATRPASAAPPVAASPRPVPLADLRVDELGVIPVLMYHQLLARPTGAYDQSPAQFRSQLETLYQAGFVTITAADLVAGRLDVPAGKSPMVLTFDDSTTSQYAENPDGTPAADTAVALLLQVGRAHGQPRPVATFYVNAQPFGNHPEYLPRLTALGMELGDHTATHANLRTLGEAGVQAELTAGQQVITSAVPGASVTTMALPFGAEPRNPALATAGGSGPGAYRFSGVMWVGSGPARSPFATGFDPMGVPRIRSGLTTGDQTLTASYWIPQLLSGAVRRFVSDGDPATVAFPAREASQLSPAFSARARPY